MRNLLYFCILIIQISFNAYAQTDDTKLKQYYSIVNQAEACILNNDLDSALNYYQGALRVNKKMYAKDVYNAAVVADKLKKSDLEFSFLRKLRQKGLPFELLFDCHQFQSFFNIENSKKIKLLKKTLATYSAKYRGEIDRLCDKDQFFRLKPNNYKLYEDTIRKMDKENVSDFLKLIEKYGYPTEERIGVKTIQEIQNPKYTIIITHQRMGPMQQYDFSSLICESILKGDIQNKLGFGLYGQVLGTSDMEDVIKTTLIKRIDETNQNFKDNTVVVDSSDYGHFAFKPELIASKNVIRKKFYLEDYDLNIKKTVFNMKHKEYIFCSVGAVSIFAYEKRESFENIKKQLIYY